MMTNCMLYLCWVETSRNWADGPSRNKTMEQDAKEKKPLVRFDPLAEMETKQKKGILIDGVRTSTSTTSRTSPRTCMTLLVIIISVTQVSARARRKKIDAHADESVRIAKRGEFAWRHYVLRGEDRSRTTSCNDAHLSTSCTCINGRDCRHLRQGLQISFGVDQGAAVPNQPPSFLYLALTQYLDHLCYERNSGVTQRRYAISGCMAVFPSPRLPDSYRAPKAWDKLAPGVEGLPTALEVLLCLREHLAANYGEPGKTAADIILLSQDGFLREQDWEQLRPEDVQDACDTMALLFGRVGRGERSKTGHNQGILIDYPATKDTLQIRTASTLPKDKLFKLMQQEYRKLWHAAATDMEITHLVGRPHNVRHTRPSRDEPIRALSRSTRCPTTRPLARRHFRPALYAKTHEHARAIARSPPTLIERGKTLLYDLGARTSTPRS